MMVLEALAYSSCKIFILRSKTRDKVEDFFFIRDKFSNGNKAITQSFKFLNMLTYGFVILFTKIC
jgi:hypothetical protein